MLVYTAIIVNYFLLVNDNLQLIIWNLLSFVGKERDMNYTVGQTKTAQAFESEDIANLKLRLKYANQELELPDDYTLVIVPKHQQDSN